MRDNISTETTDLDLMDSNTLHCQLSRFIAREEEKAQARRDNPMMTCGVNDMNDVARLVVCFGMSGRHPLRFEGEVEAAVRDGTIFDKFVSNVRCNDAEAEIGAVLFDLFKTYQAAKRSRSGAELGFPVEAAGALADQYSAKQIADALPVKMTVTEARRRVMAHTGQSERSIIRETRGWTADRIVGLIA